MFVGAVVGRGASSAANLCRRACISVVSEPSVMSSEAVTVLRAIGVVVIYPFWSPVLPPEHARRVWGGRLRRTQAPI